jgi:DNA invertase Pin-like site-specific DNA recombinase
MRDRISPALERSAGDRRARSSNGGNRCLDGARPWRIGLNGGNWQLVEEVVEVESGKSHRNRPGLARALEACRRYGAKLIISRLDRLSRDPVFLLSLRDASIDFTAVDLPNANRMTVGVMALVAEQEREAISQRTRVRTH